MQYLFVQFMERHQQDYKNEGQAPFANISVTRGQRSASSCSNPDMIDLELAAQGVKSSEFVGSDPAKS